MDQNVSVEFEILPFGQPLSSLSNNGVNMKIFVCMCALFAVVNGGLLGLLGNGGGSDKSSLLGGSGGSSSGGYSHGRGGGHGHGNVQVVKVIHQQSGISSGGGYGGDRHIGSSGYGSSQSAQVYKVKVISENGHGSYHGDHGSYHGDHGSHGSYVSGPAQAPVKVIKILHQTSGSVGGVSQGGLIDNSYAAPAPHIEAAQVIRVVHEHDTSGHIGGSHIDSGSYGHAVAGPVSPPIYSNAPAVPTKVVRVIHEHSTSNVASAAPIVSAPAPIYTAQAAAPIYTAPSAIYNAPALAPAAAPAPVYSAPVAPVPLYSAPASAPVYSPPAQVYSAPAPALGVPNVEPAPIFNPVEHLSAPEPSYQVSHTPATAYGPPAQAW